MDQHTSTKIDESKIETGTRESSAVTRNWGSITITD